MSEILHTKTVEYRDAIPGLEGGRIAADQKWTVFKNPNKITVAESVLVVGNPKPGSDKRYYYWRTISSVGFRRNKTGTVVPYACHRPWDARVGEQWRHMSPAFVFDRLTEENDVSKVFAHAVWEEFGVTKVQDLFPMLDLYDLPKYNIIPNSLKTPFRVDNWQDFTARVFGKTRLSKPLVAAVENTEPFYVAYAQQFRGLVPDEKLVSFLEKNHFDEEIEDAFHPFSPTIRPFLLAASQKVRDGLIDTILDIPDMRKVSRTAGLNKRNVERFAKQLPEQNVTWSEILPW